MPDLTPDWSNAIERARAFSPFFRALWTVCRILPPCWMRAMERALWPRGAGREGAPDVSAALRRRRLATALALGIGDLAGAFPLAKVTGDLSALADASLDTAMAHAITTRVPDVQPAGFLALALGKHGACELNYSSDIDPILLFDPETLPRRPREEPGEAAQNYARQVVRLLSHMDGEGYVFRVDLRLRPASEVSPLAISIDAALSHYEQRAGWERAAFIRAPPLAMWRWASSSSPRSALRLAQSLDFGAIAEIGRLTRRIRAEHGKVSTVGPGFDLKRARGGIREVEFFAQGHQLIHGGRNPALRQGYARGAGCSGGGGDHRSGDALVLGESYDRLRSIEHRLQMVSDLQTHALPRDMAAIDAVARLDGLPDGAALIEELRAITETVGTRYDALIAEGSPVGGGGAAGETPRGLALEDELAQLGFADPPGVAARIDGWRGGTIRALRSEAALAALDAIQPSLLAALARAPDPDKALARWERLITSLPSAVNLFRLLEARPALLQVMVRILALAPPLADELARRADLLDTLIDASALNLPGGVEALIADFSSSEAGDDYQRILDRVRRKVGERRCPGVQLIEGTNDPLAIAASLSHVAQAAIDVLARATIAEFEQTHGRIPGAELVILGLGRLGARR
jgi:glutamate-ammonia-ligase adenylyltransferase